MAEGRLELAWLDVFTDRALGGNPLAVVIDADALSAEAMQSLAAEIGLSETTFVLEDASRLRIFTPRIEMPLAGHPVVGATLELARRGRIPSDGRTVFRTGVGDTPVDVAGGVATMTQAEPEQGPDHDPAAVSALLGLAADDLDGPPGTCSTGIRFVIAKVRDRATLTRVVADQAAIDAIGDPALGVVAWCDEEPGVVAQRMFAPRMGIPEDPATGAAAGALAAFRVLRGADPGPLTVRQGAEVGRPSTIEVEATGEPGVPGPPRVGGRAVTLMEGTIDLAMLGG